jgi:hypothetical protein
VTSAAPVAETPERRLPPVPHLGVASMALAIATGVYLASYLPGDAPLGPAIGLLAASGVCLLASLVLLARIRAFAWERFFLVARWSLVAYLVIAAMLEYVFVRNDLGGTLLLLMTLTLATYAVNVPTILAFTVARFEPAEPERP